MPAATEAPVATKQPTPLELLPPPDLIELGQAEGRGSIGYFVTEYLTGRDYENAEALFLKKLQEKCPNASGIIGGNKIIISSAGLEFGDFIKWKSDLTKNSNVAPNTIISKITSRLRELKLLGATEDKFKSRPDRDAPLYRLGYSGSGVEESDQPMSFVLRKCSPGEFEPSTDSFLANPHFKSAVT